MSIKKPSDQSSEAGTSRRDFLKIAGLTGLVGFGAAYTNDLGGLRTKIFGVADENHDKIDGHQFKLGNFNFVIPTNQLDTEKAKQLEQNIRTAYKKLEDYFGEKVLAANYEQEIVVNMGSGQENWGGQVGETLEFDNVQSDQLDVKLPSQRSLAINGIDNIRSITHELFHLAVQWNMPEHSLAITEGHAEALEHELGFGDEVADKIFEDVPELEALLSQNGWDISRLGYSQLDEDVEKSPERKEQDGQLPLVRILRRKWRLDWLKLLKKDPDFLKKYYEKIAEYKKTKNLSPIFKNDGLYDTAQSVFPGFREWRDTMGISTKPIFATAPAEIMLGKMVSQNKMLLINIGTEKPEGPTASQYHYRNAADKLEISGACETCEHGKMVITITTPPNEPLIRRLELPEGFTPESIQFEGKEVKVTAFLKEKTTH